MTVTPLGRDQDCSLKIREPDVPAPWFLDPGGWSKTAAVSLYFIFPGICTLSLSGFQTAVQKSELQSNIPGNTLSDPPRGFLGDLESSQLDKEDSSSEPLKCEEEHRSLYSHCGNPKLTNHKQNLNKQKVLDIKGWSDDSAVMGNVALTEDPGSIPSTYVAPS
ncbi:hypothetical protein STEG23_026595 [Scotinomys teguina]